MSTSTLTIRLPVEQREALKRSAQALKKTESEFIRDLLQRELDSKPLNERLGHLIGCLDSTQTVGDPHPLRDLIRERNWRR
jgi:23S rRNA A2030 N6-methylase RlmJ